MRPKFIGNRWDMIAHKADCHVVNRMSYPHNIYSQEEAIENGYKPCQLCQPSFGKIINDVAPKIKGAIEKQLNKYGIDHLHYMAPIENIPSILDQGILSNKRAKHIDHKDFSDQEIQLQRKFTIMGTLRTPHDYVPLYFATHTPMQYVITTPAFTKNRNRVTNNNDLIFIELDAIKIFKIHGVVFTDGNVAASRTCFCTDIADLDELDWNTINSPNQWPYCYDSEWKRKKASEVLVPDAIPATFFTRIVVFSNEAIQKLSEMTNKLSKYNCSIDSSHY
ncbi:MAG: DUF4433 domain-containing protein [Deltaproteobacteria bacterium]|nr:DUF4433 domain-containing protein [Deltaproteobacteria bacterium]